MVFLRDPSSEKNQVAAIRRDICSLNHDGWELKALDEEISSALEGLEFSAAAVNGELAAADEPAACSHKLSMKLSK